MVGGERRAGPSHEGYANADPRTRSKAKLQDGDARTRLGAEQKGLPQRRTPSRPWGNLVRPKPPKRTSAKSGDFDEGKTRVSEAALAEPDVLHFPPLNLPRAGSTNPEPEQASTKGGSFDEGATVRRRLASLNELCPRFAL